MNTIMVPLDGTSFGERALPLATAIARRAGAAFHLLHIYVPVSPEGMPVTSAALRAKGHQHDETYLAEVCQRLVADGAVSNATYAVRDGAWLRTIHEHAGSIKADLIVMMSHERGGAARLLAGNVATGLVHTSSIPMLLIPAQYESAPDWPGSFQHMLVPLDGSAHAEQILPYVVTFGRLMQAPCTLMSVVTAAHVRDTTEFHAEFAEHGALLQRTIEEREAYLRNLASRLHAEGLQVHTRVFTNEQPAEAILVAASEVQADLLALATHGRGGLARLVFGSVADHVIRHASMPVLAYRPATLK